MPKVDSTFRAAFCAALDAALADPLVSAFPIPLEERTREQLILFAERLAQANTEFNLTAITAPEEIAVKHVVDALTSLAVGRWPLSARVCDVGTGPGVPGVVLAVVRPDLKIRLVDSSGKKLRFVESVCRELGLDAKAVHARAEDMGRDCEYRETFDVVIARAVARLPVLLELCLPLSKVGGWVIAMKGPDGYLELDEAQVALGKLGGVAHPVREVSLPLNAGDRTVIAVEKVSPTPGAYPRRAGLPAKRPLV